MSVFMQRLTSVIGRISSIRSRIIVSYVVIISLLLVPTIIMVISSRQLVSQYNTLISNVSNTNNLIKIVKTDISTEIWDIVAGKKEFEEGRQYEIIDDINARLNRLAQNLSAHENATMLHAVVVRTMDTLKDYVDKLGLQMEDGSTVAENLAILEEIRNVKDLAVDTLQEFMVYEIESASHINDALQSTAKLMSILMTAAVVVTTIMATLTTISVSNSISRPLTKLETLAGRIAEGDLEARAEKPNTREIIHVTDSLNTMAGKIKELVEANIAEQRNLQKSEMKALQAQITPHFLYNTFDTIVWLAETGKTSEVISITRAFSNFFRISLSKGRDWITVIREKEHVNNYLTIQKIRYSDILDYNVEIDDSLNEYKILKLLLQPLVENALYHGIKNRRGRGIITVKGWKSDENMCFCVEDNGIGMTSARLNEVRKMLEDGMPEPSTDTEHGFGMHNVDRRLKLYYGLSEGLKIESEYKSGTKVSFCVPILMEEPNV